MGAQDEAMTRFKLHFKTEWLSPRFWKSQVYHTRPGVAATTNPLEQYHGKLKKSPKLNKYTPVMQLWKLWKKGYISISDLRSPNSSMHAKCR
jgi:hypothetical protein